MKYTIITLLCALTLSVGAQSVTPRTGNATNTDNTYRVFNYKFYSVTDAIGNDTTTVVPKNYHTEVSIPILVDSISIKVTNTLTLIMGMNFVYALLTVHLALKSSLLVARSRWGVAHQLLH